MTEFWRGLEVQAPEMELSLKIYTAAIARKAFMVYFLH